MEKNIREYSQLEMLKNQMVRCDEELLIILKRRIQTSRKIADALKKQKMQLKDIDEDTQEIMDKALSRAREMGIDATFSNDLFDSIEQYCKKEQEQHLNK